MSAPLNRSTINVLEVVNLSYPSFQTAVPELVKIYKSAKSEPTPVDKIKIICEFTDTDELVKITIRETFAGLTEDLQKNGKVKIEEGKSKYRIKFKGDYKDSLQKYGKLFIKALLKKKLIQHTNVGILYGYEGNSAKKPRRSEMKEE